MAGVLEALWRVLMDGPPGGSPHGGAAPPKRAPPPPPSRPRPTPTAPPRVLTLLGAPSRIGMPYWVLRGWRNVGDNVWLGHFRTTRGTRHGVIKWRSPSDFSVYIHDVPAAILNGPHGACFQMVKPGKFRVHFAQIPHDMNSAIFFIETILREAFEYGEHD